VAGAFLLRAPPTTGPDAAPAVDRRLSLLEATCAPVARASFAGRLAEAGYIGYRECSGRVRNLSSATFFDVDVWVDYLDAEGRPAGACRNAVTAKGPLRRGEELTWTATCPVDASQRDFRVRFTDPSGSPFETRDDRTR
jgi:hypothetical protein